MRAYHAFVLGLSVAMVGCPGVSDPEQADAAACSSCSPAESDAGAETPPLEDSATDAATSTDGDQETPDAECERGSPLCPPPACVPTGVEVCDALDNDCNGLVDDGLQRFGPAHVLATQLGVLWDTDLAVSPPDSAAAGGYLATYVLEPGVHDQGRLFGVRVGSDGGVLGEPFLISADAANYSKALWRGDGWSVLFTTRRMSSGHASTLSMVDVDPTTGAVGAPVVLGAGPGVLGVRVAESTPPIATWVQSDSVWAATLGPKPQARSILAGGARGRRYMVSSISVLDDRAEWALWTSRWDLDAEHNSTFPLYYVTLDANLRVRSTTQLFAPSDHYYPTDMLYLASTQQLVGHVYQNGETHLIGHARSGADFAMAPSELTTMLRDGEGYAELNFASLQRFTADGALAENTMNPGAESFGEFYDYFGFSPATAGTRNRFAVVGAVQGVLSLKLLGCQ